MSAPGGTLPQRDGLPGVLRLATEALKAAVVGAFALVVVTSFLQVVARYVFAWPFAWAEELVRLANIWCVLLAVGFGIAYSAHFRIGILSDMLPPRLRRVLDIVVQGLMALIALGMVVLGASFVQRTMMSSTPMLGIPHGIAYAAVPVGFAAALAVSLARLVAALRDREAR